MCGATANSWRKQEKKEKKRKEKKSKSLHTAKRHSAHVQVLFRCEKILDFDTVVLSFLFDKHYLIME